MMLPEEGLRYVICTQDEARVRDLYPRRGQGTLAVPKTVSGHVCKTRPGHVICTQEGLGDAGVAPKRVRLGRGYFQRSIIRTPALASSWRRVETESPTTACGSPTTCSMNAPPSESMVKDPATCSGSPVAM